jgi:protein-tyrosine phosphatase
VIDLHSHILHGLDDGARNLEQSLEIARAAFADGIVSMAATPHVRDDYPTTPAAMGAAVAELREALVAASIPLELHTGGEIALNRLKLLPPEALRELALAGSRYLLLEFPYSGWPLDLPTRIFELQAAGFVPVLAHPERSPEVIAAPERVAPLVAAGALVQVTAASLDGRLGRRAQRSGLALVRLGLAHLVASDAHAPSLRGVGMSAAAEAIGDPAVARRLTVEVPAAIVADEAVPQAPPPVAPRRPWWSLRR